MGIYRLTSGRFRRFEEGRLTEYVVGDLVDLNAHEARRLRRLIKPVGRAPKDQPLPCPEDAPEPEALSGPVTSELPDEAQGTDPGDIADEATLHGFDTPESVGGTPVFTASETPEHTVTELRTVVANIGEPSVLSDMVDAEAGSDKPRKTVFTLLETRHRQLAEAEEEG